MGGSGFASSRAKESKFVLVTANPSKRSLIDSEIYGAVGSLRPKWNFVLRLCIRAYATSLVTQATHIGWQDGRFRRNALTGRQQRNGRFRERHRRSQS